jgi:acyl-homoserine-lactone acylase
MVLTTPASKPVTLLCNNLMQRFFLIALVAATLGGCSGDSGVSNPIGNASTSEYSAEIQRTSFGYPHIRASNEKGLGYGVGYAFAQDNFCLLAEDMTTINGERSKYFGPTGTYDANGDTGTDTNLPSDFFYKIVNDAAAVQAAWERQSTEIKDLSLGYAAGVNRYLADTGAANLPAECRNAAWVRPITELDLMRSMRRYALTASGGEFIDAFYAAQPPTSTAAATTAKTSGAFKPAPADYWESRLGRDRLTPGSNGVALGKSATSSGTGMLLGNPHFPWTSPYRFYQLHVTIPGKVDAIGASLSGGFPAVQIGHNGNVAWTHTVNTSRHFTLFNLQLDPADPTKYIIDGQSRAMGKREVTVDTGAGKTARRTYYSTEHGLLLTVPNQLDWTTSTAFAFGDANAENDRLLTQWWALNKATTLDEFKQSIETVLGLPWVHAVATDRAGNAYYSDITVVPNVTAAKQKACIAAPFQPLVGRGVFVLAGNTAACKWGDSPGTPQKGIFAASELPSMLRTDYVQNSNDSAWLTNPAQPLTGFPDIVSIDSTPQAGRTRIGVQQIADRLAGTDGLPGNKFTLTQLKDIAFSNRSFYSSVLLSDLRAACAASVTAPDGTDITKPCKVLASWDGKAELDSIGWPLFDAWRSVLNSSGVDYWSKPFDPARGISTPSGLRVSDTNVANASRQALAVAASALANNGFDIGLPWGQTQVAVRGAKRIPIHGGDGADIYNAIFSVPIGDGLRNVVYGSSTAIAVSFETNPPTMQGWLTYSQSTNPASPNFADQTERFSRKEWITFPYTQAQIQADPNYSSKQLRQ